MALGDAQMKVVFTADTADGVRGLKAAALTIRDLETALKELQIKLKDATGDQIPILNNQIRGVTDALKQAKQAGLEPMVSGLGKLGQGAEEAFSAVRKLAYILPGIGIAGLFNLAFEGISKLINASKEEDQALQKIVGQFKTIKDIQAEGSGSQEGEISRVNALAAAVRNSNLTYAERKHALDLLKETNKAYFGDLTLETSSLETLSGRIHEYSEALIQAAVVKGFTEQISKATEEFNKQKDALDALALARQRQEALAQKEAANNARNRDVFGGAGAGVSGGTEQATALKRINDQFLAQRDIVEQLSTVIAKYRGQINAAVGEQIKLDPLKALGEKKVKETSEKLLFPVKISPDLQGFDVPEDEISEAMKQLEKNIEKMVGKIPHVDVKFPPVHLTGLDKALKEINDQVRATISGAFEAVGQGLGELLSGSGIGGFVNNLGHVLGEAFKSIGKILIQAGVEMLAIQDALKALKVTPEVAIIAGIAAVALGALIESATSKKIGATAFATGGIVTGPTLGLVGEAGPEAIIPLDKLNQWMRGARTGNNMNVNGEFTIRGNDLITVLARANKNQGLV